MAHHLPWSDEEILLALHLRDHEGLTGEQIGQRFGRTRSSVIATMRRVEMQTDEHDLSPHLNGTMKPMWWKR